MTVNAITDTKKGRTGIAPTYLHTTQKNNSKPLFFIVATQTIDFNLKSKFNVE